MTERQAERLRDKIKQIKRALAAEKRKFGGYDDSRGMRYIPPQYYLKLQDFAGAKRYFNWFHKNFPDDVGFPQFLFEWAITLFYCKQKKQAGHMLLRVFGANPFLVDQFLGNELRPPYQTYQTDWQLQFAQKSFPYHKKQPQWSEFAAWLEDYVHTDAYLQLINELIAIEQQLKEERVGPERSRLVTRRSEILYGKRE
ncbi:MAG: hypothetical protein AAF399_29815 [Bacteroidota bacterium]